MGMEVVESIQVQGSMVFETYFLVQDLLFGEGMCFGQEVNIQGNLIEGSGRELAEVYYIFVPFDESD